MKRQIEKHGKDKKVQPNMNLDAVMYYSYSHDPEAVNNMLLFEIRELLKDIKK